MGDIYNIKYINGRVDTVEPEAGDGDDIITFLADADQPPLERLTINGQAGDDNIDVDSALFGEDLTYTDTLHFNSTDPTSGCWKNTFIRYLAMPDMTRSTSPALTQRTIAYF